MPKERSVNPAQAQRKADKQKEIAKARKQQLAQRNEKLARRNPERLQRHIDELKDLESRGVLRPKDKETLAQLEKDLRGIKRARDALGDSAPRFPNHERRREPRQEQIERRRQEHQHLGKRRRDEEDAQSSDSDPEARSIPMPRDTPPPFPRPSRERPVDLQLGPDGQRRPHALPAKPAPAAQTVYSSAPQIRDLKKEAVKFMPSVVSKQQSRIRGQGRLLEPEELDKLEKSGYAAAQSAAEEAGRDARFQQTVSDIRAESGEDVNLDEEARKFEAELGEIYPRQAEAATGREVQMEEVEDEGT